MITKKEDLINTYIENDFGELRQAYIDKAIELGYNHQGNRERGIDWYDLPYIAINDRWDDSYVGQTADITRGIRFSKSKLLTLSDLKPRTKTEFVKVTGSIFDLKDLLENEELYFSTDTDEYDYCNNERDLCAAVYNGNIYRKVETEIDERQEFIDAYASLRHEFHGQRTYDDFSGFMYDSGKFKLVE